MSTPRRAAPEEQIVLNGIDFLTGNYLTPPLSHQELVELVKHEFSQTSPREKELIATLNQKTSQPHLGFDANLEDLSQARWGVIFARSEDDKIKKQIEILIRHRRDQLGFTPPVFEYTPEMSSVDFLSQHGVAPGFGEVDKVPYYLLLVGDPTRVPFRFQYELGSEYAVGRLAFDDGAAYEKYIAALIDYETVKNPPAGKQAVFWGTANKGDRVTRLTSESLIRPLHDGLDSKLGFEKQLYLADHASRDSLIEIFSRTLPPSLVFSASHGLGYGSIDSHQLKFQGALVTQEWMPNAGITAEQIFSGEDITETVNVRGLVHFAFACFSAGTPSQDDFAHGKSPVAPIIATNPFVANLPQKELTGGALAFIGHIERAWTYSFISPRGPKTLTGFERALKRILRGIPIGHALRDQHDHALQLSHSLLEDLNAMDQGKKIAPSAISELWIQRNDARSFALIGDPAARLRVHDMP